MQKNWKIRGEVLVALLKIERDSYGDRNEIGDKSWDIWAYVWGARGTKRDDGRGTCYRAIRKMAREGLLERSDDNRYKLSGRGRELAEKEYALSVIGGL